MRWINPVAIIRESFLAKIFCIFTSFIIVISAIFTSFYIIHERKTLTEQLFVKGNLLANLLSYNARIPVFAENYVLLVNAVESIMEHDHVVAASVMSSDGKQLVEKFKPGKSSEIIRKELQNRQNMVPLPGHRHLPGNVEFYAPIISGMGTAGSEMLYFAENPQGDRREVIGLARVVMDTQALNRQQSFILTSAILITSLLLVLGSITAFFIVKGVTQPLQKLAEGVKTLGKGDLSTRITLGAKDEIGQLAQAFNSMVQSLKKRDEENRYLSEALQIAQKKEAKEEWERTFDTVPDLIAIFDCSQRIVQINRAMAERFGIAKEEAVGKRCFEIFHDTHEPEILCHQAMLANDGIGFEKEIYEERLDSYFWITVFPLRKTDNELSGFVHVARDITERKKAESEKKLIQAKLIQANKMTSLGLLVSGMAHEVNNPNNNIKFAAHLLSRSWDNIGPILEEYFRKEGDFIIGGHPYSQVKDNLPTYIAGIGDSARRIEGIIKNLRDFVRKGKSNINSLADVNMVVTVSSAILNFQIKKHTSNFSVDLIDGLPSVRGNPQLLEQVVINLIMNAIQSLDDRSKGVSIATRFDAFSGMVTITVTDEGCGMTQEVKQRVFEPFFSTKLDSGGTGLGLAISNVIVKDHNGSLEFESRPGKGTTATVRLPAVLKHAED